MFLNTLPFLFGVVFEAYSPVFAFREFTKLCLRVNSAPKRNIVKIVDVDTTGTKSHLR